MLEIFNYNAGKGDCIRLHFTGVSGKMRNVIIDSGVMSFGKRFRAICEEIENQNENIDVLIVTHSDVDHLGGLLWNLRNYGCDRHLNVRNFPIREVWMNHGQQMGNNVSLSVRQRDEVYTRLIENGIEVKAATAGTVYELDGTGFNILWPLRDTISEFQNMSSTQLARHSDYGYSLDELMKESIVFSDGSIDNRISIIFETCIDGCRMLFTGDAWAKDILETCAGKSVEGRGYYDLIKLPHHGSIRNMSEEWAQKLQCKNYIIPTDGIAHPDKQTIAQLLKWYGEVRFFVSGNWWRELLMQEDTKYEEVLYFIEGEKILWEK